MGSIAAGTPSQTNTLGAPIPTRDSACVADASATKRHGARVGLVRWLCFGALAKPEWVGVGLGLGLGALADREWVGVWVGVGCGLGSGTLAI